MGEIEFLLPILKNLNENLCLSFKSPEILNKKKGYEDLYNVPKYIKTYTNKNTKFKLNNYKMFLNFFRNPKYLFLKLKNFNLLELNPN